MLDRRLNGINGTHTRKGEKVLRSIARMHRRAPDLDPDQRDLIYDSIRKRRDRAQQLCGSNARVNRGIDKLLSKKPITTGSSEFSNAEQYIDDLFGPIFARIDEENKYIQTTEELIGQLEDTYQHHDLVRLYVEETIARADDLMDEFVLANDDRGISMVPKGLNDLHS